MSVESPTRPTRPSQQVLANLEVNDTCAFTATCGSTCYLNQVHVDRPALSSSSVLDAARALIRRGDVIRHLAIPGKEPFQSGGLVRLIAEEFHRTPVDARPASLGVISASTPGIRKWLPRLSDTPLCWLAVSVDVAGSGLRAGNPFDVLGAALAGRQAGGTGAVAVNTTFRTETIDDVLGLAPRLAKLEIDQWALCTLILPAGNSMVPAIDFPALERVIERLGAVSDAAAKVVVETDLSSLLRLVGGSSSSTIKTNVWRIETQLPNGVWLFARNPAPGYFLRVRYDGAILSRGDFMRRGVSSGRYGLFTEATDIDKALNRMDAERLEQPMEPLVESAAA